MANISELTTPIDRATKLLFKIYADVLLRLAFPNQRVRLVSVEENVEINLPTRWVDKLMLFESGKGKNARQQTLHAEHYTQHTSDVPRTLFIYSGELTDLMNMQVATVVLYTERRPPERRPKPEYVVKVGNTVINRFTYRDIWLMDYEAEIRSGTLAPLAPFLLEVVAERTEETVETARELALTEPVEERRSLLLSLVALLAGRYFEKEVIRKMFRQELERMKTNTFFDDWLEEAWEEAWQEGIEEGRKEGIQQGIEQGIEQGRQEGATTALRHSLLLLLEHKLGTVPVRLVLRINDLSLDTLSRLFDLALDASSLEEIEATMSELNGSPPASPAV